jgi:hypothetical protein
MLLLSGSKSGELFRNLRFLLPFKEYGSGTEYDETLCLVTDGTGNLRIAPGGFRDIVKDSPAT